MAGGVQSADAARQAPGHVLPDNPEKSDYTDAEFSSIWTSPVFARKQMAPENRRELEGRTFDIQEAIPLDDHALMGCAETGKPVAKQEPPMAVASF